jgi:hypothetical protein
MKKKNNIFGFLKSLKKGVGSGVGSGAGFISQRYPHQNVMDRQYWLKVPKREIFHRSDFPDFYTMKSLRVGDFGVKIKKNL